MCCVIAVNLDFVSHAHIIPWFLLIYIQGVYLHRILFKLLADTWTVDYIAPTTAFSVCISPYSLPLKITP